MTFYINAWLDHPKPFINVYQSRTNELLLHFSSDDVEKAIADGDFCLHDFYKADSRSQHEMVHCLFLARCRRDVCTQCEQMASDIISRGRKVLNLDSYRERAQLV